MSVSVDCMIGGGDTFSVIPWVRHLSCSTKGLCEWHRSLSLSIIVESASGNILEFDISHGEPYTELHVFTVKCYPEYLAEVAKV